MFELVFLSGPRAGAVVPITGKAMLGRSPDCTIEVPDLNASRHHAVLEWDGATLLARDNGSINGIFVNDQQTPAIVLKNGDVLRLGETRMRLQQKASQSSSGGLHSSSMFSFRDAGADLSQSLSLSALRPAVAAAQSVEVLSSRLTAILGVSECLAKVTQLPDLPGPVLDAVFQVFPQTERAFLMLGSEWDKLKPFAMRQREGRTADTGVSSTLCRESLRTREILTYKEGGKTAFDEGMSIVALNIRNAMVVPLMVPDEVLGLLVIDTSDRSREFTQDDMTLAAGVCGQISVAIRNALLIEQVKAETEQRRNLSRYVPRHLIQQWQPGGSDLFKLGGSACHGTIFFADIVAFTRMVEHLPPEEVVAIMNHFLNRMVPQIEGENGSVDKFMGDCIMAVWGIPINDGTASQHAARAGLALQNALVGLNSLLAAEDRPTIQLGVGMEAGPVVAGNIGIEERKEYTVLGDTVNTASRIQAVACASQVLLGGTAWREISDGALGVSLPPLAVKNKTDPVSCYSLRGIKSEGEEYLLHIPAICGTNACCLIRRLRDGSFILLHDEQAPLKEQILSTHLSEREAIELGRPQVLTQYPIQAHDGFLRRSLIRLRDESLGGLFKARVLPSDRTWDHMHRGRD